MTDKKFANDHDIIGYTFVLLIQQFQKEDNIFAAQCTWWLASIIQYTEILKFYLEYQVFPSEYVSDLVVTPLPDRVFKEKVVLDNNISELDLAEENLAISSEKDYINHLLRKKFLPKVSSSQLPINQTRSRKILKPQKIEWKVLAKRYPGKTNTQPQQIRDSLRKDGLLL